MGHGWVIPNPNGSKARCGGPTLCPVCQREQADASTNQEHPMAETWIPLKGASPEGPVGITISPHPSRDGYSLDLVDGEWRCRYWLKAADAEQLRAALGA